MTQCWTFEGHSRSNQMLLDPLYDCTLMSNNNHLEKDWLKKIHNHDNSGGGGLHFASFTLIGSYVNTSSANNEGGNIRTIHLSTGQIF